MPVFSIKGTIPLGWTFVIYFIILLSSCKNYVLGKELAYSSSRICVNCGVAESYSIGIGIDIGIAGGVQIDVNVHVSSSAVTGSSVTIGISVAVFICIGIGISDILYMVYICIHCYTSFVTISWALHEVKCIAITIVKSTLFH